MGQRTERDIAIEDMLARVEEQIERTKILLADSQARIARVKSLLTHSDMKDR
jgi:hypothetical protein